MQLKKIAVLFGGCSAEYEVSLASASAVLEHLDPEKYTPVMIGITRDGRWFRYRGNTALIREDRWYSNAFCSPAFISPSREVKGLIELSGSGYSVTGIDAVFPVLHGRHGEDGTVQGLLELSGLPFVGCGTLASAVCMDKEIAHTLVRAAGIGTPPSFTVYADESAERAVLEAETLGYPVFVKPAKSGSSVGITKAHNTRELTAGLKLAFSHDDKVVIERHVTGFEVGCAVMGNHAPVTGEIDEIELSAGFFDFHEKYSLETSRIHLPARISAEDRARIKETALTIYRTLGCRGLARIDLFLTPEGGLVFNEVNTMPGFTAKSRYPSMLRERGLTFSAILDRLISLALSEPEEKFR